MKKHDSTDHSNRIIRKWLMVENETRFDCFCGIGMALEFIAIFLLFSKNFRIISIMALTGAAWIGIAYLCSLSKAALYFSRIGKQMMQYGTITEMKKKIAEYSFQPLYFNTPEMITSEFLFLIQPKKKGGKRNFIEMIPLADIKEVWIAYPKKYSNEFNELCFETYKNKKYVIRVYLDYKKAQLLIAAIRNSNSKLSIKKEQEKEDIFHFKQKREEKNCESYNKVQKHIFIRYCLIWSLFSVSFSIIIAGISFWMVYLMRKEQNVFLKKEWELIWYSDRRIEMILSLMMLAVVLYGIPFLMILLSWIQYRKSIRKYEQLPYSVRSEIEKQIADPKIMNAMLFTREYLCFRENRWMGFYNIICYHDIVRCYPQSQSIMISNLETGISTGMPADIILIFFTRDRKKHKIHYRRQEGDFWRCYKNLQNRAPHAEFGYRKNRKK